MTNSTKRKNEQVAFRLADILRRLNNGETLCPEKLSEEYQVSVRTVQRDLNERLNFLDWEIENSKYKLQRTQLGIFNEDDIRRFAGFASIQDLFPKIDRTYFQEKLLKGIKVKGFEYENIKNKEANFIALNQAIKQQKCITFYYSKAGQVEDKYYELEPYRLVNKNGIWYLIGLMEGKERTFCFSKIKTVIIQDRTFEKNTEFSQQIETNDSIYYGNQTSEVVLKVSKTAAPYFLRRNLLPNQETVTQLEDGVLLLKCCNVNSMEILPIVQYWIPHVSVISPESWQQQMEENLKNYLNR